MFYEWFDHYEAITNKETFLTKMVRIWKNVDFALGT
jgi:hypothetical protein